MAPSLWPLSDLMRVGKGKPGPPEPFRRARSLAPGPQACGKGPFTPRYWVETAEQGEEEKKERKEDVLKSQLCVFQCLSVSHFLEARYRSFTVAQSSRACPSVESYGRVQSGFLMLMLFFFISEHVYLFIHSMPCCYDCKETADDKRDGHIHEFGRSLKTALGCDLFRVF